MRLEINNLDGSPVKNSFLEMVARRTLEISGRAFLREKKILISAALVSGKEMKKLNLQHRRQNSATDVLSFAENVGIGRMKEKEKKEIFLGELVLCYDEIRKYARKEKLILRRELAKTFAHGILHLLGFRHGEKMFALQEKISADI